MKPPFSYCFPGFPMVFLSWSSSQIERPLAGAVADERRQHRHGASPHRAAVRGTAVRRAGQTPR